MFFNDFLEFMLILGYVNVQSDDVFINYPFEEELENKGISVPITINTISLSELIDNMKKHIGLNK